MDNKYSYKGQNITLDMYAKIQRVAELIAQRRKKSFDESLEKFYSTKVYQTMQNTDDALWAESAEYIFDLYCEETGQKMAQHRKNCDAFESEKPAREKTDKIDL